RPFGRPFSLGRGRGGHIIRLRRRAQCPSAPSPVTLLTTAARPHAATHQFDWPVAGGLPKNVAMFFRATMTATLLALSMLPPVVAGELRAKPKAVLELFTSQGCSSCPQADALLEQ